ASAEQITARQNDVLRDLIDEHLMLDRAKELGLNADNEVVKRLSQMMKESGVTTRDELEKLAEQSGVTLEDFKDRMRKQVLTKMSPKSSPPGPLPRRAATSVISSAACSAKTWKTRPSP